MNIKSFFQEEGDEPLLKSSERDCNSCGLHRTCKSPRMPMSGKGKKKILVFGVMKDKEYEKMLEEILPAMDTVIFTKPNIERALSPYSMQSCLDNAIITDNMRSALEKAKTEATEKDLILVTGSFYTIGEAKTIINEIF